MGYTKTNWANGDVITAEKMNNLESGVEALATQSPPDWNQNDPNGDGYIANRPFYIAGETNTEIINNTFSFNNSNMSAPISLDGEKNIDVLENGMEFTAYYDGTYYSGEVINKDTYYLIGNCSIAPIPGMAFEANANMPFLFVVLIDYKQGLLVLKDSYIGEKNISISIKTFDVHKIDSKYLPDSKFDLSDRMAKGIDDDGIEVQGAVIEGAVEDKDITNPNGTSYTIPKNKATGDCSHAEGTGTTASGKYSHAEGYQTTASGKYSHVEGSNTTASGDDSHAEGYQTTASGDDSHAEGYQTTASGQDSHAEGYQTTASGQDSHAEGYQTTASGQDSHVEGSNTTASGDYSHAEGQSTIANHRSQHVFGELNIEDPSTAEAYEKGTYVEIVGNGSNSRSRSNARTLDWQGNERLAGSLTLGDGTNDVVTISAARLKNLLTPMIVEKQIEIDTDSGTTNKVLNMAWQQIHDAFVSGRKVLIFFEDSVSDYELVSYIGFGDNEYIVEDTSGVRYRCDTASGYPSVELTN